MRRLLTYLMAHNLLCEDVSPYLSRNVVLNLRKGGITSVGHLICAAPDVVAKCSGLPLAQVKSVQHTLLSKYNPHPVSNMLLLKETREKTLLFPFGCNSVDELLKGGVYSVELTEVWGPTATGKTQLCLSLACGVVSATPYTVAYVDGSAGGFSPTHLQQCLRAWRRGREGTQEEEVLAHMMEKVHVFKVFSVYDLLSLLYSLQYHISNQTNHFYANIRLLIVDPITLYLAPLLTFGSHGQGHVIMAQAMQAFKTLIRENFIAIVCCNNVVSAGGGEVKPALGQTWATLPSTKLSLSSIQTSNNNNKHKLMIVSKSPRQIVGRSAKFNIANTGVISEQQLC